MAKSIGQPCLATLTARFLQHEAPELPLADVEPHEQSASFATEAATAWAEAVRAAKLFGVTEKLPAMPSEWAALVRSAKPVAVLPFAFGHFPQLVSDWSLIGERLPKQMPRPIAELDAERLFVKAERSDTWFDKVLAASIARLVGEFDRAETLLKLALARTAAAANVRLIQHEQAIVLWMRGDIVSAKTQLSKHELNPVVEFNLGLLCLQLGETAAARNHLRKTTSELGDETGWKYLAELYAATAH